MHTKETPGSQLPLSSAIDYRFVGHLEQFDDAGRLRVWEGNIKGGISGKIQWWFVDPSPAPENEFGGGKIGFYAARWEILEGEKLLLAGDSAGKTVFLESGDGIWDGHGVVTQVSAGLDQLKGNKVYETGPVIGGVEPPVSFSGTGMFVIY